MTPEEVRIGQRVRFVARTGILREGVVAVIHPNGRVGVEYFSSARHAWIQRTVPLASLVEVPK